MRDKEIIEALECCYGFRCEKCPLKSDTHCRQTLMDESIALINRQQAEIERLKEEHDSNFEKWEILDKRTKERYAELYEEAKGVVRAKAIKEFEAEIRKRKTIVYNIPVYLIEPVILDNLVKEMVGIGDE